MITANVCCVFHPRYTNRKQVLPLDEAKLVWQLVDMEKRWPLFPQV
jgi:hypothetical protein